MLLLKLTDDNIHIPFKGERAAGMFLAQVEAMKSKGYGIVQVAMEMEKLYMANVMSAKQFLDIISRSIIMTADGPKKLAVAIIDAEDDLRKVI